MSEYKFWAFIYGATIGSFINVLIYRLPRNLDLVFKRSSCSNCGYKLQAKDLVPLLSFIFLRGRCSSCKTRFSFRYFFVELIVGLFAMWIFPSTLDLISILYFLFYFLVFCILLTHFFIDLDFKILPDSLNIILLILMLIFSIINFGYTHWLIGGVLGFTFTLLVTWIFYKIKGQIGLGGGDIKLFGILGIYLGPQMILKTIFVSCFLGAIVGLSLIALKKLDKNDPIAFGPYIIIVAIVQIFLPEFFTQALSFLP